MIVILLLLLAVPAVAEVELKFVVEDEWFFYHVKRRRVLEDTPFEEKFALEQLKRRGRNLTLAKAQELSVFATVREHARRRARHCQLEWEVNREATTRYVEDLVGPVSGRWTVQILPRGIPGGVNMGNGTIVWGGYEPWPNYTTVYLWHEVLHDRLPRNDLGHVIVQLVTDQGLRCHLDKRADPAKYEGHPELEELTQLVQPHWDAYLKQPKKDFPAFFKKLQALKLKNAERRFHVPLHLDPDL